MKNQEYEVQVLVNGKPIREFYHQNKTFVEGRKGFEYVIKIKNNSWGRILGNVSVDSINVIDGEVDSYQGYVIAPHSSLEIKGFRTSDDIVRAFKFSGKSNSYAAKSAETNFSAKNAGIIGTRIFLEKQKITYGYKVPDIWMDMEKKNDYYKDNFPTTYSRSYGACGQSVGASTSDFGIQNSCCNFASTTNDTSAQKISSASFDLGTQFTNNEIDSKVVYVDFERGELAATFEIYYASKNSLIEMGVPIVHKEENYIPKAFPEKKYCKPPTY